MWWNFHIQLANYARYIFVSSPFNLFCNIAVGFWLHTSWRLGQKSLSKNGIWYFAQNPLTLMSNLVSSFTFLDLPSNVSRVKIWRGGSTRTSWHTWSIRYAIMLHKWLCLNVTKPPFLHDKLCWRLYFAQQLHIFGKLGNGHPYHIFTRSMGDVPKEDVFKLSASAAASEFCEWVQVGIDVYIFHRKYQVKPHSSPWFSAACTAAIVHRNHFFCLHQSG